MANSAGFQSVQFCNARVRPTGESSWRPLVSYFASGEPDTVDWSPTTFEGGSAECLARCCGLKFELALVGGPDSPMCLCGDLWPDTRLGLSVTSPPAQKGRMQVVQLPTLPSTGRKTARSSGGKWC